MTDGAVRAVLPLQVWQGGNGKTALARAPGAARGSVA
jgi:hypothetical protein